MLKNRPLMMGLCWSMSVFWSGDVTAQCEAVGSADRLFSPNVLHASWQQFEAEGFSVPVTGVVYRGNPRPTCGMPLGGLDTGCLDIEPNGMLGYCTIFNHLVYPRALLNVPFMGLSVGGETWVLASDTRAKEYRPLFRETTTWPPIDFTPAYDELSLEGVRLAKSIDYWGHYPMLDMEYSLDSPVSVGVRAWSPFIPGDSITSMTPASIFEVRLRNTTGSPQSGSFLFSFPGFNPDGAYEGKVVREVLADGVQGVQIATIEEGSPFEMGYVLAAESGTSVRAGGPLNADGVAWSAAARDLPAPTATETGASIACDFELAANEVKQVRFVLAWHAPYWYAGGAPIHTGTKQFEHMYAKHHGSALDVARTTLSKADSLKRRIIAWQEVIHKDKTVPGWLAECLINNLHLITECSVWAQAKSPVGDWCKEEDGIFGMNECPRGCPQIECIPCTFYGGLPIVYFFPDAALANLRGYKAYQFEDGRPPWIFGGATASVPENNKPYDMAGPDKGYQSVLNGASYIVLVDRYWKCSGDDAFLEEFWDSLKRANDWSLNLRPKFGMSQVMAMPEPGTDSHGLGDTEWFEAPEPGWKGYVTHAGAVRMAQVQIIKHMAKAMGDKAYVKKCDAWLEAGSDVLEERLWTGSYYLNFDDPDTGARSDLIFGYQLDGEWIADTHGVDAVFPQKRVRTTLETLRDTNIALSQSGATNYANPDGTPAKVGGYGTYSYFPPELMMLSMNYMYEGQKEFGTELLKRCMENIVCTWGYTWDAPNIMRGDQDTGQRHFGADYYQDMMLWSVPAAMADDQLSSATERNGLVSRMIRASAK